MEAVPRVIILTVLLLSFAVACGAAAAQPKATEAPPPTAAPRATSPAGQAPPSARGSLQLSGGVSGFLSVLAVSCEPQGAGTLVTIKGRVENKLYDLDVSVPGPGGYQLGSSAVGVQLSSQTPDDRSVSRWSAGQNQRTGGSLSISADFGGTIDADLQGTAGTGGSVHLRGGWSCSA